MKKFTKRYVRKQHRSSKRKAYKKYTKKVLPRRTKAEAMGSQMQNTKYTWVKKKYQTLIDCTIDADRDLYDCTISHIGGTLANSGSSDRVFSLTTVNQAQNVAKDMGLYQLAKITGVSFKIFFPEGTDIQYTPTQYSLAYSPQVVVDPDVTPADVQTVANFISGPCCPEKPVSRYFNTFSTLKRLGIDYFPCKEFSNFGNNNPLYNGQLPKGAGSCTNIKIYRSNQANLQATVARIELVYYVQYKGTRAVQ